MKIIWKKEQHRALVLIAAWAMINSDLLDALVKNNSVGLDKAISLLQRNTDDSVELGRLFAGSYGAYQVHRILLNHCCNSYSSWVKEPLDEMKKENVEE